MKIAQEELLKSRKKNKTLYDRRAKRREFQEGDKVLLLLPTNTNKLLMQWKEPYETKFLFYLICMLWFAGWRASTF